MFYFRNVNNGSFTTDQKLYVVSKRFINEQGLIKLEFEKGSYSYY